MNKLSANTDGTKSNTSSRNKGDAPAPEVTTMVDCYKAAWATALNKLSKEQQEVLLKSLEKPMDIVRGKEVMDKRAHEFVKQVNDLAENLWALQEKKKAVAAKQSAP